MSHWFWILVGLVASIFLAAIALCVAYGTFCAVSWCAWKRRQIRRRAEWTQENPYRREAFDAGVRWAQESDQRKKFSQTSKAGGAGDDP